jgi:hypothetical protein
LTAAKTLDALQSHVQTFRRVADDAWQVAQAMDEKSFLSFVNGVRRERRGHFAGAEWAEKYGAILMPSVLMRVSMVADQFKVPWGCAYIRLRDVGRISEQGNVARWIEPEETEALP